MSAARPILDVLVRAPKPYEHELIGELISAAFAELAAAGQAGGEAALVDQLRKDGDLILELVALEPRAHDVDLVGHIAFSRLSAPAPAVAAALAPVSVAPRCQGVGIGGALIRAGLEHVQAAGVHVVTVLGHPDYYPRFGFSAERAATLVRTPWDGPHMMALELAPCAWPALPMPLRYARAFGG